MPQLHGKTIKDRAARLRAAGDEAVARHLAAQKGRDHNVLMETPHMGRTEQFAEVEFTTPRPEGALVSATITGHRGQRLTA